MPKLIKPRKHAYQRHACRQCTAVFVEASHLGTHVRTIHSTTHTRSPPRTLLSNTPTDSGHVKRRDHACPHCAAAFGHAGHLTTHVRMVHEKRRDHACPHCDYKAGQAGNLRTHVRMVHEQRRDHACSQCDYNAGTASDLTKHVNNVCSPEARRRAAARAAARKAVAEEKKKAKVIAAEKAKAERSFSAFLTASCDVGTVVTI